MAVEHPRRDDDRRPAVLSSPEVKAERQTLLERIGRWMDAPLAFLALAWTGMIVVQLALPISPKVSARLSQAETAIWVIFAADFVFEFVIAPDKVRYLRSNVLVAISIALPFARALRIIRLAAVLRSLSLARLLLGANRATRAAGELFQSHQFGYVVVLLLITVGLGSAGVYYFELGEPGTPFDSFGQALWWAATLVTTINVGEEPVTAEGRIIGILLRVVGLAVFGYVTASIASYLLGQNGSSRSREKQESRSVAQLTEEVRRLRAAIDRLEEEASKGSAAESDDEAA